MKGVAVKGLHGDGAFDTNDLLILMHSTDARVMFRIWNDLTRICTADRNT